MVEFALTAPVFFLVLMAAVGMGLYSFESAAAVSAAAEGARAAASASPADPNTPNVPAAFPVVVPRLKSFLFGTSIRQMSGDCDSLNGSGAIPAGTVEVCSLVDPANPNLVKVEVVGRPAYIVPVANLPWAIRAPIRIRKQTFER